MRALGNYLFIMRSLAGVQSQATVASRPKTTHVSFTFPTGRESRVVTRLPVVVGALGSENCYNSEGANLVELFQHPNGMHA